MAPRLVHNTSRLRHTLERSAHTVKVLRFALTHTGVPARVNARLARIHKTLARYQALVAKAEGRRLVSKAFSKQLTNMTNRADVAASRYKP
jgi:hypothetical protein